MKILTAMKLVKEDGQPVEVQPGLYIGSIGAAYNKQGLEDHKITHILTCAANIKPSFPNVGSFVQFLFIKLSFFRVGF